MVGIPGLNPGTMKAFGSYMAWAKYWMSLRPGSRVVSHRFNLGGWTPDRSVTVKGKDGDDYELHLWTIKAKPGK